MNRFGLRLLPHRGIWVPPGALTKTYATAIGNGVTNGRADLPVHGSATILYVNSQHANRSDSNAGTDPNNPLATVTAVPAKLPQTGASGQRVRVAKGMQHLDPGTYNISGCGGLSALYPTVVESYDPADPLNPNLWGAGLTKADMAQIVLTNTGVDASGTFRFSGATAGTGYSYWAFRGLSFETSNYSTGSMPMSFTTSSSAPVVRGMLFERCIFNGVWLTLNFGTGTEAVQDIIMRDCGWKDTWHPSTVGGCFYLQGAQAIIEDCDFYHGGWKYGALRTDPVSSGGEFNECHNTYAQFDSRADYRRCFSGESGEHGISIRGNGSANYNLSFANPTGILFGADTMTPAVRPNGVICTARQNLIMGGRTHSTELAQHPNSSGDALAAEWTQPGSVFEENIVWDFQEGQSTINGYIDAGNPIHLQTSPTHFDPYTSPNTTLEIRNNLFPSYKGGAVRYDSSNGGSSYGTQTATATFTGTNYGSVSANGYDNLPGWAAALTARPSIPNAVTMAQLVSSMGYPDLDTFGRYLVDNRSTSLKMDTLRTAFQFFGRALDATV